MSKPITFQATVYKVATLADMGLRVTLDLPEDAVMQAAQLMECKRAGVVLSVVCNFPDKQEVTEIGEVSARAERKSRRATT